MSGVKNGLAGLALTCMALTVPAIAAAEPAPKPKLVVAISVDQFSANLFEEWRPRWKGGFKRLSDGVVYPSGYQSHAATETCPGHSTILTGKHPNKTGIVANDLRDPATGKIVYCLFDASKAPADGGKDAPVGPGQLMATTLGDWLKTASPQSRVVTVSAKDRGAINLAGHKGDGVFWYKPGFGFTTYMDTGADATKALAPIAGFNAKIAPIWTKRPQWTLSAECRTLPPQSFDFAGKAWSPSVPPAGYGQSDDKAVIGREIGASPLVDDLTLQAAEHLIAGFKLGQGPATDILGISFSATDYVGHRYGTRGPEMCDQLTKLDGLLGRLFADLDKLNVPYVVVLTADHGGSDFPERTAQRGYDAKRIDGRAAFAKVRSAVQKDLGLAKPPAISGGIDEVYIDEADPAERARIALSVKKALLAMPEIKGAWTQGELLATPIPRAGPDATTPDELTLQQRYAESTYPGRSGDVLAAVQPYMMTRAAAPGDYLATHGSPWNYDRRVPILFWWKGAPSQTRYLPIETVDIAPTLATVMGLDAPKDVDGRPLPLQ